MHDHIGIPVMPEELVADLARLLSDVDRLVEDQFLRRIGFDLMNDQHMGHVLSFCSLLLECRRLRFWYRTDVEPETFSGCRPGESAWGR